MYATIQDMKHILPDTISIGDQNLGTPSPGMNSTKRDTIPDSKAKYYIRKAQEEIDARLRSFYVTPLRRTKTLETPILTDAIAGANSNVKVHDSGPFSIGELVRIQNRDIMESATITDIPDMYHVVLDSLDNEYLAADDSLISILEYPDPVPLITARLAVAIAFDELFNADQAPNISSFGNSQRQLAFNGLDSILDGTIKLYGQEMTGRRFIRGTLFDAYSNPVRDFQFGREKPSSGGG